jgi:steroid delta-isomerase-like uncharacterized protein
MDFCPTVRRPFSGWAVPANTSDQHSFPGASELPYPGGLSEKEIRMKRNVIVLATIVTIVATFAASAVLARQVGQPSGHRQQVIRFFDQVWTNGNLEVVDEMLDQRYARYAPSTQGTAVGIPAFKELVTRVRSSFSNYSITLESMTGVGDKATIQWRLRGNYIGPNQEIQPGRQVELAGTSIWFFRGEKILKEIVDYDEEEYYRQIELAMPYTEIENRAVVLSVFYELYTEGNLDAAYDLVADDHVLNDPGKTSIIGPEGFRHAIVAMRKSFPDLRITIHDMVADGDLVTTHWTVRGTHRGDWHGIDPTGQRITETGMTFMRVKDGKIHRTWNVWDRWGLRRQLTED